MGDEQVSAERSEFSRFRLRLLLKHPNVDPAEITKILKIMPNITRKAGEPKVTPRGTVLPGVHQSTVWVHTSRLVRGTMFSEHLSKYLARIQGAGEYFREFEASGGRVEVIVELPGDVAMGNTVDWKQLHAMSALHVDFGIEVFPNFK